MKAEMVVRQVRQLMQDEEADRWTDAELLGHLSAALRALALTNPAALSHHGEIVLQAGARQQLPEDGVALLAMPDGGGGAPAYAIRLSDLTKVNHVLTLLSTGGASQVDNWAYEPAADDRRTFWVSPLAVEGVRVQAVYAAVPGVDSLASELGCDIVFEPALTAFVCFLLTSGDTDAASVSRAATFQKLFSSAAGGGA